VASTTRDDLRSVMPGIGALSVMTISATLMLRWPVTCSALGNSFQICIIFLRTRKYNCEKNPTLDKLCATEVMYMFYFGFSVLCFVIVLLL